MGRLLATLTAVLVLALLAGGLTEATLAYGHGVGQDNFGRPSAVSKPVMSASPKPTPVEVTPSSAPSSAPSPSLAAATATTSSFVHMREGMSTSTTIVLNLNADTVVTLLAGGDATWQEVEFDGYQGYVYKSYLTY